MGRGGGDGKRGEGGDKLVWVGGGVEGGEGVVAEVAEGLVNGLAEGTGHAEEEEVERRLVGHVVIF